jgi:hypothetical protein
MSNTHDWNHTQKILVAGSIPAFNKLFNAHPLNTMRAIGYTWEWGQPQAAFYCVANTQNGLENGMRDANLYRTEKLKDVQAREEVRWSAGYFQYPAGLLSPDDELGPEWKAETETLHAMAEAMRPLDTSNDAQYAAYERDYEAFHANLVRTCCEALAEIARTGLFEGATSLDYWVGSTDDHGDIVRDRDAWIKEMIAQGNHSQ